MSIIGFDGIKNNIFSTARTWNAVRPRKEEKTWNSDIWFKGAVPKHVFLMWISHLNRLPTSQGLFSWSIIPSSACTFCSVKSESRDHILLTRTYSSQIWLLVLARIDPHRSFFLSWAVLLSWVRVSSNDAPSLLRKIAMKSMVFHLWKQRNNVVHNQLSISLEAIFTIISKEVCNIITARRHRKRFCDLMQLWLN